MNTGASARKSELLLAMSEEKLGRGGGIYSGLTSRVPVDRERDGGGALAKWS